MLAGNWRVKHIKDENIFPILSKTLQILQNCYEKLKERKDTWLDANPVAVRQEEGLQEVYREIRQIAHAPVVAEAKPQQFPIVDPMNVPILGDLFTSNPEASMAIGRKRNDASAPNDVQVERPPKRWCVNDFKPAPRKLPQGLSFNVVCKSCGRRRSKHVGVGGSIFSSNCFFTSCARCSLNKRQHGTLIPVGYFCTIVVSPEKAKRYEENLKTWATK